MASLIQSDLFLNSEFSEVDDLWFRSIETEIDNELENELEYDDLNNCESDDDEPKIVDLLADGKDVDITDENIKLLNIIENERPSVERLYKSTSCNCGPGKKCFMMIPLDEFLM